MNAIGSKYEVEIKVELTDSDRHKMLALFKERGFGDKGITPQEDRYIRAEPSEHGAFDVERYRTEPGKIFYTKKVWEVENGKPIRREDERMATLKELDEAKRQHPNPPVIINKDRHWFEAEFEGRAVSLTIDSVKFAHSDEVRHFMEAEIDVADRADVAPTKTLLKRFLGGLLGIGPRDIQEAPGMFAMAYKKL